jgi:peroxiredoxin
VSAAALVARLVLAAVFAVAAAAKLRDRPGVRFTLEDFGLPAPLAGPGALLLPLAELTVAGLLLPDATAPAGAIAALALLGAFTAAITVNLARGRHPDCNCFGQLHSEPVGAVTLVRNGALMVLAGFVLASGQPDAAARALDGLGGLDTATALALAALVIAVAGVVILGWVALHLLRQQGRVLLRLDALDSGGAGAQMPPPAPAGLPVGAPAPPFELPTVDGGTVALAQLIDGGRPLVLAFVDPGCEPCRSLLPRLAARQVDGKGPPMAVVISGEDADAARAMAAEHGVSPALLDRDGAAAEAYDVTGTPMAVAIGPDGLIRSELAAGIDAVQELLDHLDRGDRDGLLLPIVRVGGSNGGGDGDGGHAALGERIPDLELEGLDGVPTSLRAAVGDAPHLMMFWSPTCGYCDAMLDAVRALEARDDLPPLLLVATGDADANRAQGLRSRTLLDPGFEDTGTELGVAGTPSALRLDGDGRIVSRLAVGADSVLALAGVRPESLTRGG